jgi:aminopeptidase N
MALYSVEITTGSNQVVAATGVEVDRQTAGAADTIRFASGPAREFFIALSDQFEVESKTISGTRVNSYYLPGHSAAGKMALGYAGNALGHYNELFGRYPYRELDIVEAPMTYAAGVEFPGIVLINRSLYETMRQPFFTYVVAHEVGHQWWYNVVGNDVFDHPWLDEGLTTYAGALYWEAVRGGRAYQQSIDSFEADYDRMLQDGQDHLVTESQAYFEALDKPGVYGTVVYDKGALFFHHLRQEIGWSAFFKALQAYYQAHRYGIAVPEDLLRSFEEAAGRELDGFYEEWLYSKK